MTANVIAMPSTPAPAPTPAPATIETADLRRAAKMARAIMASRTRIGRLIGEPGSGKTEATKRLTATLDQEPATCRRAIRLCMRRGITEAALIRAVAAALGVDAGRGDSTDAIMDAAGARADGVLLILDEANHLHWQHLERLRWLSDEAGAGLLLVGTDLLSRTFRDGRNRVYLAQMVSRIGAKQVTMHPMDIRSVAAYCLTPRFGQVHKTVAETVHKATGGWWRECAELADACQRVIDQQPGGSAGLTLPIVNAARQWLAERDTPVGGAQ